MSSVPDRTLEAEPGSIEWTRCANSSMYCCRSRPSGIAAASSSETDAHQRQNSSIATRASADGCGCGL
ncbi:MAG: hypothetical protein R2719_00265 [Micropruina sp.]